MGSGSVVWYPEDDANTQLGFRVSSWVFVVRSGGRWFKSFWPMKRVEDFNHEGPAPFGRANNPRPWFYLIVILENADLFHKIVVFTQWHGDPQAGHPGQDKLRVSGDDHWPQTKGHPHLWPIL
jgi:hypothetical protein